MTTETIMRDTPCVKGHMSPRYASNGRCCECSRLRWERFRAKNRGKLNAKQKKRQAQNPRRPSDASRQCSSAYYERNKAECLRRSKAYREANLDRYAGYRRTRRARVKAAPGEHTEQDIIDIFKMQKGRCGYCKTKIPFEEKRVDHIVPLARGGHNGRSNLQILCEPCNVRKSAIDPVEFARKIGRLI